MKKFEVKEVCKECNGTGLYVGIAERDGAAVVCHTCNGTGCHIYKHEYEEFIERNNHKNTIKQVYQTNPGICIGENDKVKLEDFGGISYEDWINGNKFEIGTENRKFTCPAWWFQCADYKLKPKWNKCIGIGCFSECKHFENKSTCWEEWDKLNRK